MEDNLRLYNVYTLLENKGLKEKKRNLIFLGIYSCFQNLHDPRFSW